MPICNGSSPSVDPSCFSIIVMGVSGTGKSTLGSALAEALGMPYVEGDNLHPKSNIEKMSSGQPLNDADREPWLETIRRTAEQMTIEKEPTERPKGVVISCSALRYHYREILRGRRKQATKKQEPSDQLDSVNSGILPTFFVFIDGSRKVLIDRLENRPGHFMKAAMLESQLRTLESPIGEEGVVTVALEDKTEDQVRVAIDGLNKLEGPQYYMTERER